MSCSIFQTFYLDFRQRIGRDNFLNQCYINNFDIVTPEKHLYRIHRTTPVFHQNIYEFLSRRF